MDPFQPLDIHRHIARPARLDPKLSPTRLPQPSSSHLFTADSATGHRCSRVDVSRCRWWLTAWDERLSQLRWLWRDEQKKTLTERPTELLGTFAHTLPDDVASCRFQGPAHADFFGPSQRGVASENSPAPSEDSIFHDPRANPTPSLPTSLLYLDTVGVTEGPRTESFP